MTMLKKISSTNADILLQCEDFNSKIENCDFVNHFLNKKYIHTSYSIKSERNLPSNDKFFVQTILLNSSKLLIQTCFISQMFCTFRD